MGGRKEKKNKRIIREENNTDTMTTHLVLSANHKELSF